MIIQYCQSEMKGELALPAGVNNRNLMSRRLRSQSASPSESEDETSAPSNTAAATKENASPTVSPARREEQERAAVDAYCDRFSAAEPEWLAELRAHTEAKYAGSEGALRMLCSQSQGRLLVFLTRLARATHVLELGTFTGYSSLCFAEALHPAPADQPPSGVVTCDVDEEALSSAQEFIKKSPFSDRIDIRHDDGMQVLSSLAREGRAFDLLFLDADKRQYQRYVEVILENHLLRPGGLILVDNTLWKGLVLHEEADLAAFAPAYSDYGKKDRMQKLAAALHQFNAFLKNHAQLQPLLLPLRDGLTIVQYVPS